MSGKLIDRCVENSRLNYSTAVKKITEAMNALTLCAPSRVWMTNDEFDAAMNSHYERTRKLRQIYYSLTFEAERLEVFVNKDK